MKEQLIHILDESACLTRRQMKHYLSGDMLPEEVHAAEVHLASCPLCSMAMEGFEAHTDEALAAIDSLNSGFLKEHFARISPQIHLNSMAPAAAMPVRGRRGKSGPQPLWRVGSIAAALLLGLGIMWYMEFGRGRELTAVKMGGRIADNQPSAPAQEPAPAASGMIASATSGASDRARPRKEEPDKKDNRQGPGKPEALILSGTPGKKISTATLKSDAPAADAAAPVSSVKELKMQTGGDEGIAAVSLAPAHAPASMERKEESSAAFRPALTPPARSMKIAPGLPVAASKAKDEEPEAAEDTRGSMDKADDLAGKGRYSAALGYYKKEMESGSRSHRHTAAFKAAQCYRSLGQKTKAIQILQSIVAEGGPQKHAAKKLLHELQGAAAEPE